MQHVEEAGIHSGDSACVLPPHALGEEMLAQIREQTTGIAKALGVIGLLNVQFAIHGDEGLHVIEANPRASRTVPFVSKAIGLPLAKLACRVLLGERLAELDLPADTSDGHVCVKEVVLPFDRFAGADSLLGPEMRSTGEVMGIAARFPDGVRQGTGGGRREAPRAGTVFITVADGDKPAAIGIATTLHDLGFEIVATPAPPRRSGGWGSPRPRSTRSARARRTWSTGSSAARSTSSINTPVGTGARTDGYEIRARGGRPRDPMHHHDGRRHGGGAGDRCGTPRRARGLSLQEIHAARANPATALGDSVLARERGRSRLRRAAAPITARERTAPTSCCAADRRRPRPDPGQFYMLTAGERWGGGDGERPFLPRAFSVLRAPGRPPTSSQFMIEDVGPGTNRLGECKPARSCCSSARSGSGSPPLGRSAVRCWSAAAWGSPRSRSAGRARSTRRVALLGFRDDAHAAARRCLPSAADRDRRRQRRPPGLVTELLEDELDRDPHAEVYACGPPAMLEAVRALCAERRVPAQLALESGMACGFGACFGCVVPTHDGYVRLCVDGPVLDAERLPSALIRATASLTVEHRVLRARARRTRSSTHRAPSTRSPPSGRSVRR